MDQQCRGHENPAPGTCTRRRAALQDHTCTGPRASGLDLTESSIKGCRAVLFKCMLLCHDRSAIHSVPDQGRGYVYLDIHPVASKCLTPVHSSPCRQVWSLAARRAQLSRYGSGRLLRCGREAVLRRVAGGARRLSPTYFPESELTEIRIRSGGRRLCCARLLHIAQCE